MCMKKRPCLICERVVVVIHGGVLGDGRAGEEGSSGPNSIKSTEGGVRESEWSGVEWNENGMN